MEEENKKENTKEETVNKGYKKYKSKKSVNWESNEEKEKENKKKEVTISNGDSKDFLEIEVIKEDGKVIKERVKYEHKTSKEFTQKREENSHQEYTKAKEFFINHKSDEE